jgi:hypothetical protein
MIKRFITILCLLCATQVFAASQQTINQYADNFMTALNAKTPLTEEQKKTLRPVLVTNLNAREDVISSYMGQKGMGVKRQIRDALQPINEQMQGEAQNILTPEQFEAFKQVQSDNQDEVRDRINRDF